MRECSRECRNGDCYKCQRDALAKRVAELEAENARIREYAAHHNGNALGAIIADRDALSARVAELEAALRETGK